MADQPQRRGFFGRLRAGLSRSTERLTSGITSVFAVKRRLDDEALEELEDVLIMADLGPSTAAKLTANLAKAKFDKEVTDEEVREAFAEDIAELLEPVAHPLTPNGANKPHVILVVGVNGVGKTTSIGKLAHRYKAAGHNVLLGAADTFRAAAIDQLKIWGERVGVEVIAQQMGSDPASVAFDTLQAAVARQSDVVIIDTAGRLHNKKGLMEELSKVRRVMDKIVPGAPHEVLLVLDGSTGQNALEQARQFTAATAVTGLVLTKLDGTAKGGAVLSIADSMHIPVRFIGVGAKMEHLQDFVVAEFIDSLLPESLADGLASGEDASEENGAK